jgi:hypothetical protein
VAKRFPPGLFSSLLTAIVALAACGSPKPAAPSAASAEASASPNLPPPDPPPPPLEGPLTLGSQSAKDDMYCAGVLWAAFPDPMQALIPADMAVVMQNQNLATALSLRGTGDLIDARIAKAPQVGAVAGAWMDEAEKDFKAKKLRIPVKTCQERGIKIVQAQPN